MTCLQVLTRKLLLLLVGNLWGRKSVERADLMHHSLCKRRVEWAIAAIWHACIQHQETICREDCGVFTCMYTRSLVNLSPMIFPNCSQHFWSQKLHDPWTARKCYVANSFTQHESGWILCSWLCRPLLFRRVMSSQGNFIRFKFLHPIRHGANAADSFD